MDWFGFDVAFKSNQTKSHVHFLFDLSDFALKN